MPIDQLKLTGKTETPSTVERIQQTLKNPFSLKALALSLGFGIVVTLLVTGILTTVTLLSNQVEEPEPAAVVVEEGSEEIIEPQEPVEPGETFIDISKIDTDGDGIYDWVESDYGTNPLESDTDFDGFDDLSEITNGFDPSGFGRPDLLLSIEKIQLEAPITFPVSRNEDDIQAAMAKGVAYYPGTAFPGQDGNTYITGHSSDYAWNPGDYKRVFRQLNDVEVGDIIVITMTYNSGYVKEYSYEVYEKRVLPVNSTELWIVNEPGPILTTVTSWPIDSTRERLMVRSRLLTE